MSWSRLYHKKKTPPKPKLHSNRKKLKTQNVIFFETLSFWQNLKDSEFVFDNFDFEIFSYFRCLCVPLYRFLASSELIKILPSLSFQSHMFPMFFEEGKTFISMAHNGRKGVQLFGSLVILEKVAIETQVTIFSQIIWCSHFCRWSFSVKFQNGQVRENPVFNYQRVWTNFRQKLFIPNVPYVKKLQQKRYERNFF